jgi:hypothetical protein
MTDLARDFSWAGYRALVGSFLNAGYEVRLFGELDPAKAHLVLRHDIDFSMTAAVNVARIEADLGVRSHYYVLLRTEFYNLFGRDDWGRLHELLELGHDVGLHFDASLYDQDIPALDEAAARECNILEDLLGRDVTSISFHRPARMLQGLARQFALRSHTYEPRFFSDIAYVTDSRGMFRYGHPLDHPGFADRKAMQLLTHPIWWCETEVHDKMTILDDLLDHRSKILQQEAASNCIPYAQRLNN